MRTDRPEPRAARLPTEAPPCARARIDARMTATGGRPASDGRVVGRESELAAGEAFLESAGRRLCAMLLEGDAGIGKTTVWQEIARRAGERGFGVLSARPAQAETGLAFAGVTDLLEPIARAAFASLPAPQRRALDIALLRVEPDGRPLDSRTVATAVRSLFAELSAERPLLVAIDDVQWLDATSAAVLGFALRRLTARRVGWLLARRATEAGGLGVDALSAAGLLTRQTLGPLTLAGMHRIVTDRLDRPVSRAALVRIHEASDGNPLYALEIAHGLDRAGPGQVGARLPVPASLRELVAERIPALAPDARAALLAAAASSQPTVELVEAASSPDGLAAAEESGLLRVDGVRVVFAHPLYASAVYTAAATSRRRRVHRRLAQLVADREERARHLAVATSVPDAGVAGALEDAAALARSRGAWDSAAELLEHARALTPAAAADDARRRAIAAAQHHVHAGDRPRARALVEGLLSEALPRPVRADALRLLAEISYHDENFPEARRLFAEALEHADDRRLTAVIELGLNYVGSNLMDFDAARLHAYRALECAEAAADRSLVGQALAHCAMLDFLCGRGVDSHKIERAVALEDSDALVPLIRRPSTLAACLLLYVGRHADARERLGALCATARERGDESDLAFVLLWLSWLQTRTGDLVAAAVSAEEAASLATLTGSRTMHAWALTQRALVHAHRGEVGETRRCLAHAAGPVQRSGNLLPALWIGASIGLLELSLGNPDAAWRACEPLTVGLESRGVSEPVLAFFLPDALEALIALGELDRAEALLDAFEACARQLDRTWALATGGRCRGLLLAARGDLAGAAEALGQAVVDHERLEMPFERARTLLASGVIERRMRKRARAKASFEQALATFEDVGARLWAARARAELDRVGLRRGANGELTGSERRVAQLAAQGLTNREVAAALFVSPKTVDAQLGRVYRKLGIASRAELGARMASGPVRDT